ncbi:hypothetical protein AXX12_08570 [Anaerosporomusa subterranea]|uniref:Uncharacterized protein n=1 Tax=Anaerosporomusa subterranea TaxID=1794912 RepID=A0A154BRB1_ANASB|nr:hypothetical protein [Anaerosporomusa subterranea]KYZ76476.1 hypothetical protein AXX12_08570 [Anaerosporomusa subterranea]
MIAQITLTPGQAKVIIAAAILKLPAVEYALQHGKVVLKSGTTVAYIAKTLGVPQMRLGGRFVPGGARTAPTQAKAPHIVVIENGDWRAIDTSLTEELLTLQSSDVFITGANAIDQHGVAGLLAGLEGGSAAGNALGILWSEGIQTIIAAGLEKLIPGSIIENCKLAGRKRIEKSMGMAVGVLPLTGKIITEKEAIEALTGVKATVIAAGGILGAEGATTMLIEGSATQIELVFSLILPIDSSSFHCHPDSLISCQHGGVACSKHLACVYKDNHSTF